MVRVPPPRSGDYNPLFAAEVSLVPDVPDFCLQLRRQCAVTRELLARFSERNGDLRSAAGKWSVREIAGHLIDTERILSCRALRLARGDQTPLSGFDQEAYVAAGSFVSRTMASLSDEFLAVRSAATALVDGLPDGALLRRGLVGKTPITVAALLHLLAGHELHRQEMLRSSYLKLLPAPEPTAEPAKQD